MTSRNHDVYRKKQERCSICGSPVVKKHAPFCSGRCADIDLHRWLSGAYTIPGTGTDRDICPERHEEENAAQDT